MQAERAKKIMAKALELASRAGGQTFPNPLVGAVVVRQGRIVGQGYHKKAGQPHAEILALQQAGSRARGAALFCTFEPCFHEGRTPACVDTVISSGVSEVYIGSRDPNPLTHGRSVRRLKQAGIKVFEGVCEKEVRWLNEAFFCAMTKKRPLVTLKIASSMDGKTATRAGYSQWITSSPSRTYAHRMRNSFDAIMVGIKTVLKDNPRLEAEAGHRLVKVIVDSSLRLPLTARLLKTKQPVIVAVLKADRKKTDILEKRGVMILRVKDRAGRIDLKDLLNKLGKLEIRHVLVEGGTTLAGSFLDEKLADKIQLFLAPVLLGGRDALGSIAGRGVALPGQGARIRNMVLSGIGEDLLVQGDLHYPASR